MPQDRLVLALRLPESPKPGLSRSELHAELERLADVSRGRVIHWLRSVDDAVEVEAPSGPGRATPILFVANASPATRARLLSPLARPSEIETVESSYAVRIT